MPAPAYRCMWWEVSIYAPVIKTESRRLQSANGSVLGDELSSGVAEHRLLAVEVERHRCLPLPLPQAGEGWGEGETGEGKGRIRPIHPHPSAAWRRLPPSPAGGRGKVRTVREATIRIPSDARKVDEAGNVRNWAEAGRSSREPWASHKPCSCESRSPGWLGLRAWPWAPAFAGARVFWSDRRKRARIPGDGRFTAACRTR